MVVERLFLHLNLWHFNLLVRLWTLRVSLVHPGLIIQNYAVFPGYFILSNWRSWLGLEISLVARNLHFSLHNVE